MVTENDIKPVELNDRPVIPETVKEERPPIVTETDLQQTQMYLERLLFDVETEVGGVL